MALRFLDHGGEMGRRIRAHDWQATPLGGLTQWPAALRSSLGICLGSSFPTAIYWGPELRLLYNDAWAPIPADRHPACLGKPASEVWHDIWDVIAPQFARVIESGEGFSTFDQMLMMERDGVPTETYWNYSFTPIRDEAGDIVGIFNQGNETTRHVLAERARLAEVGRLRDLFQQAPGAVALLRGPQHVYEMANPAYIDLVGGREVLGKPVAEALPEVVEQGFVTLLDRVYASGEAYRATSQPVTLRRGPAGEAQTRILDFVYQPIQGPDGRPSDIFVEATDVTERAQAEAALRASEERLQLAFDAAQGLGSWDWDIPSDVVAVDHRLLALYDGTPGVDASTVSSASLTRAVHPDDRSRVIAAIRKAITSGEPFIEEYRLQLPDGSIRDVVTQGRCHYGEDGSPRRFPGITFDITVRKRVEAQARAAAEDLRTATEAQGFIHALAETQRTLDTPESIMAHTAGAVGERLGVDRVGFFRPAEGGGIAFAACWTNGELPALTGSIPAGVVEGPMREQFRSGQTIVVHDADGEPAHRDTALGRLSPAGLAVPLLRGGEWTASLYVSQSRARRWTAEEIAFVEAVAEVSWDAVSRAAAVVALGDSEEKFRAIANSIDQMIWSTLPDGYHDYYNDRWYEFTGVPHGSTDGEAWNGMFHPDDQERAWGRWRHSLETGEPYHIEYRLKHHSGTYRWVLGRAQPVRDPDGRIIRWFGTCTDIQEIVDAREVLARSREELEAAVQQRTAQLMAAEEQLRQAQKMEAVGQLTGGIAHDFNNMLAVVIGALDLLEHRIERGDADVGRYVEAARDGATRAAALTQRLLAFSRQQPLAPVAVDINKMVLGMIDLLTRTLGDDVKVATRLSAKLSLAMADPNQLENVILNLSVNARDAMAGGGTLTIETFNRSFDAARAERLGIEAGDYVELAVTDTGSGMPPEVAARAFDPFFTTKSVGKGTGLGLSQVFGFVRQSGGQISIETEVGRGTTMRLQLPVYAGEVTEETGAPDRRSLPRGDAREIVLVVEDDDRVRTYSVEALRELGYTVVHAQHGPEALDMIAAGQGAALLFTDMVMPEMTGRQLAERASALIPGLKVLYTSGYTREMDNPDPDGPPLLPKPFALAQLAHAVRAVLDA